MQTLLFGTVHVIMILSNGPNSVHVEGAGAVRLLADCEGACIARDRQQVRKQLPTMGR